MNEKDLEKKLSEFDKHLFNIGEVIAILSIILGIFLSSLKLYFNLENRITNLEHKIYKIEKVIKDLE